MPRVLAALGNHKNASNLVSFPSASVFTINLCYVPSMLPARVYMYGYPILQEALGKKEAELKAIQDELAGMKTHYDNTLRTKTVST